MNTNRLGSSSGPVYGSGCSRCSRKNPLTLSFTATSSEMGPLNGDNVKVRCLSVQEEQMENSRVLTSTTTPQQMVSSRTERALKGDEASQSNESSRRSEIAALIRSVLAPTGTIEPGLATMLIRYGMSVQVIPIETPTSLDTPFHSAPSGINLANGRNAAMNPTDVPLLDEMWNDDSSSESSACESVMSGVLPFPPPHATPGAFDMDFPNEDDLAQLLD